MQNHNDDTIKTRWHSLLEGVGNWTKTVIYWPSPVPPDIAVCLSRSSRLLNRRPEGPALCWVLFSVQHHFSNSMIPNSSDLQLLNRGPRGPLLLVLFSLQPHFSNSHWTFCALSYIIVRRPLNLFPWMANGICNFCRLWNGMFGRVGGQYTTQRVHKKSET